MGNKITDIKAGLPSRRMSKHTMDQQAHLTMNFGEVTSLGFLEMDGNTRAKGNVKSLVRMSPLPLPTFGELDYKTYARFIPIKDVYRNFNNLRTARSLTTQFGTFTPTSVPKITIADLSRFILNNYCLVDIYYNYETVEAAVHTATTLGVENIYDDSMVRLYSNSDGVSTVLADFNTFYGTSLTTSQLYDNRWAANSIPLTSDNGDFILTITPEEFTSSTGLATLVFRLTRLGKVVYRNLLSLGYKFDIDNTKEVSILPLLAFYKGYWDLFMPGNTATANLNYTDSYAFRLCDYMAEHNTQLVTSDSTAYSLFTNFMTTEFNKVFYYQDPDFITSMIASPSISPATQPSLNDYSSLQSFAINNLVSSSSSNKQPTLSQHGSYLVGSSNVFSALNIKLALRLLPYVNKDTIIGGKLRELLKSRFGYDSETIEGFTYTAGRYNLPITISAITNSADTQSSDGTSGQVLGQQGGLGVAYNGKEFLKFNFKADDYGYLMFYSVIVPKAGFFQGINSQLTHGTKGRFSIYDPAFDSLGFDLYTKDVLLGENLVTCSQTTTELGTTAFTGLDFGTTAFGFSPRYFDYKNRANDIVSGDLARLGYREKYSAYYLNKFITPNTASFSYDSSTQYYTIYLYNNRVNVPTATPDLRRIGYDDWLENFNRIFYTNSLLPSKINTATSNQALRWQSLFGVEDNFIIDNNIKCDYFDHSKPSSESFETDGEGDSVSVSHA